MAGRDRPRVLIVSASIGAGHDGAARELARRLAARGVEVDRRDYLDAIPAAAAWLLRDGYEVQLKRLPVTYEWLYRGIGRLDVMQWGGERFARAALPAVRRWLARGYDAVVSTYPLAGQVFGTLRASGGLNAAALTFLTDPSVHPLWVHPGVDLHMTVVPATAREVRRLVDVPVRCVGPLVDVRFRGTLSGGERLAARRVRGLPVRDRLALLVAGSWGVGDVEATVRAIRDGGSAVPVVVCGRNDALRLRLSRQDGVVALGWRDDMDVLLHVSDVLVQNAGGLSCWEALVAGIPVVSYACIPGHGRANAAALDRAGLVPWCHTAAQLTAALDRSGTRRMPWEIPDGDAAAAVMELLPGRTARKVVPLHLPTPLPPVPSPRTPLPTGGVPTAPAAPTGGAVPAGGAEIVPLRAHRLRRVARATAVAAGTVAILIPLGTEGVAAATDHGIGVTRPAPGSVSLVVRLGATDAGGPALTGELLRDRASVVVDRPYATEHPDVVQRLAAAGVPLLNGGTGGSGGLEPVRSRRNIVTSRAAVADVAGEVPGAYLADRSLNLIDLGTAWAADEKVVRPSATVGPAGAAALPARGVVLLRAGDLDDTATATRLGQLAATADAAGIHLAGLTTPTAAGRPAT